MNAASKCNRDLIRFLTASPSPFHAIAELKRRLTEEGYETLREEDRWQLKSGGKYLLTRNDTSLIAFRIPSSEPSGFMISAAHSDAPAYKIKHHAELSTAGI